MNAQAPSCAAPHRSQSTRPRVPGRSRPATNEQAAARGVEADTTTPWQRRHQEASEGRGRAAGSARQSLADSSRRGARNARLERPSSSASGRGDTRSPEFVAATPAGRPYRALGLASEQGAKTDRRSARRAAALALLLLGAPLDRDNGVARGRRALAEPLPDANVGQGLPGALLALGPSEGLAGFDRRSLQIRLRPGYRAAA